MDNTKNAPTVLSLCTGYGGIEIGLERTIGKINVLAHVEIEAYADANLVAKMEKSQLVPAPLWTDLKTLRPEIFRNKIDILTGGYPCQPFSTAGQRKGKDDPRHLWPWIREIIKGVKPRFCFFENVEGHISLGLREVLTDLVKLGYRVENDCGEPTWGLFSATEVGAPHQRKRVFILAHSEHAIRGNSENWLQQPAKWRSCSGEIGAASSVSFESLAYSNGSGVASGGHNGRMGRESESYQELANTRSAKFNRIPESEERWKNRETGNSGVKLGDTTGNNQRRVSITAMHRERLKAGGSGVSLWPARPGQPQYEWEEPRVLADPKDSDRRPGKKAVERQQGQRRGGSTDQSQGQSEPKLGRAINGTASRMDRLRLLGNGVVPDAAEKAWITLMNRIINPNKAYVKPSVQLELF